ncbi:hypothetical protein C8R47DRAFT_1322718 [Mycena vitilis]|nr:hypothetical protein C8R47DRAFT_1322718 [Mycena vitilis]
MAFTSLVLIGALMTVAGVTAQSNEGQPNKSSTPSAIVPIVATIVAVTLFLTFVCCVRAGQRRWAQSTTKPILPMATSTYGIRARQADVQRYIVTPGSEYPPLTLTECAPPPYVKEDSDGFGVPPGIDAAYTPPPSPLPRAHISSN